MKKSISPGLVITVIVILLIVIGIFLVKGTGPKDSKDVNEFLQKQYGYATEKSSVPAPKSGVPVGFPAPK